VRTAGSARRTQKELYLVEEECVERNSFGKRHADDALNENLTGSAGVAANSVYRILDLFVRNNLANRIESANAYLVNTHPGCRHDCIFLICDDCGKATHLDDERVTGTLRDAGKAAGFTDVRPVVELRGLCDDCAA